MKDITVLGAGIAGRALIERIRKSNSNCKISLIDKNVYSFDKKKLISSLSIDNRLEIESWSAENNVEFLKGHVERINPRRKKIYFKDRDVFDFDNLIVATGLTSKKLELKGDHREGFFYLSSIEPFRLQDLLKLSKEVTVCVSTLLGIKLSLALKSKGLDVTIVAPTLDFLCEDKERVIEALKEKDISLYIGSSIEEAIGEGIVKAVKIAPFKVFSSHLVFIDSGFVANRSFFEEDIEQKDVFFTNHEGLFFLGDVSNKDIEREFFFSFNYEESLTQAIALADYLLEGKALIFERRVLSPQDRKQTIDNIFGEKKSGAIENIPSS